jgi:preprotein translocase subunit SecE
VGNAKYVHLMFAVGGLLLAYVAVNATDWIWGYFGKPKAIYTAAIGLVAAAITTLLVWRRKETFQKASDIVMELSKVTWPTRKETTAATMVVIVTVIISAAVLGVFDLVWSWATGVIYS